MSQRRKRNDNKLARPFESAGPIHVRLSVAERCGVQALLEQGLHGLGQEEVIERIVGEYLEARPELMAEVRRRFAGARMVQG